MNYPPGTPKSEMLASAIKQKFYDEHKTSLEEAEKRYAALAKELSECGDLIEALRLILKGYV